MNKERIANHIRQIWAENPLPYGTSELAVTTISGIKQQLAVGSKSVHYMSLENEQLWIRLIKVAK